MSKNLIVVKSNDFVEASYKITLDEMRVLLLTIGQINSKAQNHRRDFEFTVAEFAERFNTDEKSAYAQVQRAVDMLGGRWAVIEKNKNIERKVTFLTEQAYFKGVGRFQIILHEKLMPFLSDIQGKFTEYNLKYIARFSSFHAIRIYEIITQYRNSKEKERTVLVSELKEWLQVADKYPRWDNFKARVLEPAISEINEKSDLLVSFKQIKQGRSIHAIKFLIKQNKTIDNTQNITKLGRPKLPQRPAVKTGSHEEGLYFRQCIDLVQTHWRSVYQGEEWREILVKLPTDELELLFKWYKGIGDEFCYKRIEKIINARKTETL